MKQRRILLIAVLLLTIAALGIALWRSYRPPPTPGAAPVISDLTPSQIDHIRIRYGSNLLEIARSNTGWRLSAPVQAPVDTAHLKAILSLLGQPAQQSYAPRAIEQTKTGLADHPLVVRFGQIGPIRIGGPGPSRGSRYVATPHALLLADLPAFGGLQWGWTHWISRALVPPQRQLQKLVLPHFTLVRDDRGRWQAQPAGQRSAAAVATTAQTWLRAQALAITPADQSRQRVARITLGFAEGTPRHFDIIERYPNLILRDPALGVDYHLAGNRIGPLLDIQHPGL
ncbi:hypothetical protein V5738_14775 [Salinisphaera sp. SPP-AMP-43]|uniref:hypothetical protein n=1 Tax=Salinisphaera sp. SPP-AMP-43 TaxID=3121288 RepID=UPI003C6DDCA3